MDHKFVKWSYLQIKKAFKVFYQALGGWTDLFSSYFFHPFYTYYVINILHPSCYFVWLVCSVLIQICLPQLLLTSCVFCTNLDRYVCIKHCQFLALYIKHKCLLFLPQSMLCVKMSSSMHFWQTTACTQACPLLSPFLFTPPVACKLYLIWMHFINVFKILFC